MRWNLDMPPVRGTSGAIVPSIFTMMGDSVATMTFRRRQVVLPRIADGGARSPCGSAPLYSSRRDVKSLRRAALPHRRGFGPLVSPPIGEALADDALQGLRGTRGVVNAKVHAVVGRSATLDVRQGTALPCSHKNTITMHNTAHHSHNRNPALPSARVRCRPPDLPP